MKSRPVKEPAHQVPRTLRTITDQPKRLSPNALDGAEYKTKLWRAHIPADVTVAETLKSDYLAHHANKLEKGQVIDALWEDMSHYAQYLVLSVGIAWVKVALLQSVSLKEAPATVDAPEVKQEEFTIKYSGPKQWCAFRKNDGERVGSGFQTEEECQIWLKELKSSLKN